MTKNHETGRSMVEMLGVLAVIGVLSIGGIAGYNYGMDRWRANETINDIMLRGVDIMTQTARGIEPNLESEWGTKGSVYNMEAIHDDTNNVWGVVVDGVPSNVCKMIGDALKSTATVYVGNTERDETTTDDPCDSSEENTMEFYFDAVPTGGECKTDADCGTGNYCDMGLCFSGAKPEGTARIVGVECETDADCNKDWEGNCARCDTGSGVCIMMRQK